MVAVVVDVAGEVEVSVNVTGEVLCAGCVGILVVGTEVAVNVASASG